MQNNLLRILVALVLVALMTEPGIAGKKKNHEQNTEWYLRLSVAVPDEQLVDEGNVLGQLVNGDDFEDEHDLVELKSTFTPYLTLVFPHNDWMTPGNYASDFHDNKFEHWDEWYFEVKTDDPYRDAVLYWDYPRVVETTEEAESSEKGKKRKKNKKDKKDKKDKKKSKPNDIEKLTRQMWLEDIDTGERVTAVQDGLRQVYRFNMLGEDTRRFRWVLETKKGTAPPAQMISQQVKTAKAPVTAAAFNSSFDAYLDQLPTPPEPVQ